jgi:hypothetical protein
MKKVVLVSIAIVAIVVTAAFNVNFNTKNKNNLSLIQLANVEILAHGEDDFKDCPITQYTRNAQEQYVTTNVQYSASIGFFAELKGKKVALGAEAKAGGSVGIPDCPYSFENCCAKSFIEKSPKYY